MWLNLHEQNTRAPVTQTSSHKVQADLPSISIQTNWNESNQRYYTFPQQAYAHKLQSIWTQIPGQPDLELPVQSNVATSTGTERATTFQVCQV